MTQWEEYLERTGGTKSLQTAKEFLATGPSGWADAMLYLFDEVEYLTLRVNAHKAAINALSKYVLPTGFSMTALEPGEFGEAHSAGSSARYVDPFDSGN